MDEGLISLIFIAAIGIVLLLPIALCRRRAPEESGLSPKYEAFCTGKIGWFIGTNIPCIRLSIYDRFFVVAFLKPTVIPLDKSVSAKLKKSIFGNKLLIELGGETAYSLSARKPDNAAQLLHT